MLEFLQSPAGQAVLGVFIAAIAILLLDLNYRIFAKALLDFLFAFIAVIVLSPLLIILAVISKVKTGKMLESRTYLGVKGKIIYLHSFAGAGGSIKYFARIFDILAGRLSFVGVMPLEVADGALISDEKMERFNAHPGLVCHMIIKGYSGVTYEDMFDLDIRYAKKRELFTDVFAVLKWLVYAVRGESKPYLGEAENCSYATALLNRGTISRESYDKAQQLAREAVSKN